MAVRNDFTAGEVLAAADLNDTFASKLPYSYGTATPSTSDDGFLWYDSNSTPPDVKFWDGAAFQALTSGKILQVVRATDTTQRSTTSSSFVDITGLSVTITPQKSNSPIIVIMSVVLETPSSDTRADVQITDSSNNALSGAELGTTYVSGSSLTRNVITLLGYSTPATTSAVTYKGRMKILGTAGTMTVENGDNTGQLYAIEVSA